VVYKRVYISLIGYMTALINHSASHVYSDKLVELVVLYTRI